MSSLVLFSRRIFLMAASLISLNCLSGCSKFSRNTVVIYSCNTGARNEAILSALKDELPEYDVRLHFVSTGNCASKISMEKSESEADIILALEGSYTEKISDFLSSLDGFDNSYFCEDLLDEDNKYFPFSRESVCVVINRQMLDRDGLPIPTCYDDLLNPCYKDKICMPNPKTSGTAYAFLLTLVNTLGEDDAFSYFDSLAENVYQFTSSGSGPMNALVQGEAAIGFAMTPQAVEEINQGVPLEILQFDEGFPWNTYCVAIVDGKENKPEVRAVFEWLATRGVEISNTLFTPDEVIKDVKPTIPNYPQNVPYADMRGITDSDLKDHLLSRWKY